MLPSGMGVFGIYRERLVAGLAAGQTLDELDQELLVPAPLDEDQKAALWLVGFSLIDLQRVTG
jgi:hypothetical protein